MVNETPTFGYIFPFRASATRIPDISFVVVLVISLVTAPTDFRFATGSLEGESVKPLVTLIALSKLSGASDILVSVSMAELSTSSTSCDTLLKKQSEQGRGRILPKASLSQPSV